MQVVLAYGAESDRRLNIPGEVSQSGLSFSDSDSGTGGKTHNGSCRLLAAMQQCHAALCILALSSVQVLLCDLTSLYHTYQFTPWKLPSE